MVGFKAEAIHTTKITDYLLFISAKRETRDFILAVVEDTWVCELREPIKFYTDMAPFVLLDHFHTLCGGLHSLDVLALKKEMHHYHMAM